MTGPERRRRWDFELRNRILAAAFSPGAVVADVARHYDVASILVCRHVYNSKVGIVCLISDQQIGLHIGEQVVSAEQIMRLATAHNEGNRIAQSIYQSVEFGTQSAAGSPDGFVRFRFFWASALC